MKKEIEQKMEESVNYHNNLNLKIQELEEQLESLKNAKQQIIGRIQTYKELINLTNENGHDPDVELVAKLPDEDKPVADIEE